jgi:hypothetical protein
MAVMVKVLLPLFQAEVNPPLNWNRFVLLIELRRRGAVHCAQH